MSCQFGGNAYKTISQQQKIIKNVKDLKIELMFTFL